MKVSNTIYTDCVLLFNLYIFNFCLSVGTLTFDAEFTPMKIVKRKEEVETETKNKKIKRLDPLPDEMLYLVASFLNIRELISLRLTNKNFSSLLLTPLCSNIITLPFIVKLISYINIKSLNLDLNGLLLYKKVIEKCLRNYDNNFKSLKKIHPNNFHYKKIINNVLDWHFSQLYDNDIISERKIQIKFKIEINNKQVYFEYTEIENYTEYHPRESYIFNFTIDHSVHTLFTNNINEFVCIMDQNIKDSLKHILNYLELKFDFQDFLDFLIYLVGCENNNTTNDLEGNLLTLYRFKRFKENDFSNESDSNSENDDLLETDEEDESYKEDSSSDESEDFICDENEEIGIN